MSTSQKLTTYDRRDMWLRALFMILFMIGINAGQVLWNVTALVQFVYLLVTGQPNDRLSAFGRSIAKWLADAVRFLTFAAEEKPFPWQDWPKAD